MLLIFKWVQEAILVFEPNELTVNVGDTVTFVNGDLPPHNVVFLDHEELSHPDLSIYEWRTIPCYFYRSR